MQMPELELDDFCGTSHGKDGQLVICGKVVGTKSPILYAAKCSVCSMDHQLFPDEFFMVVKNHIVRGSLPCGCAKAPKWSKEQWEVRVSRKVSDSEFTYRGIVGDFCGGSTVGDFVCSQHGSQPKTFESFMSGRGCSDCRHDKVAKLLTKPDDEHIKDFLETGSFSATSRFWRSDKVTPRPRYKEGVKNHWWFFCGECKDTVETLGSVLKRGGRACSCSKHHQKLGYIYIVKDGETPLFIKYGITNSKSSRREEFIRNGSVFEIELLGTWEFPRTDSCKLAEKLVKEVCPKFPVSRQDFSDGFTETTYIHEIGRVVCIFESNGGVLL